MTITHSPKGDGNCQFAAIAYQLNKLRKILLTHQSVRQDVTNHFKRMCNNNSEWCDVMAARLTNQTLEAYIEEMSRDTVWGDEAVLLAASHVYSVRVRVISTLGAGACQIFSPSTPDDESLPMVTLGHDVTSAHYVCLHEVNLDQDRGNAMYNLINIL